MIQFEKQRLKNSQNTQTVLENEVKELEKKVTCQLRKLDLEAVLETDSFFVSACVD